MATRLTDRQRLDRAVPERDLMTNFMDAAGLLGWKVMHISDSRRMVNRGGRVEIVGDADCKGWPDVFLCHPATGRVMAVEVKKETGKLTDDQVDWLEALDDCSVETFVLRPSGWDAAIARLRRRSV